MTWTGVHCRLSWRREDVDAFIADVLAPTMEAYGEWYFLRYWETGPHLRVRIREAEHAPKLAGELRDLIKAASFDVLDDEPGWLPHGDVREVPYIPETQRYGGPAALPVAEEVFCRSTEVAVAVLHAARSDSARFTAAIELTMATTKALDLDLPAAASWLRGIGTGWRDVQEHAPTPTLGSHAAAHRLLARRGRDLAARWQREPRGATEHWAIAIRSAQERLGTWLPYVWASQLHMLLNRLGITPNEERMICWTAAATALSPDGLTSFHTDGADAADRRYLEASKFLPGFDDQLPRKDAARARWAAPWHTTVSLPEPSPVDDSLRAALRSRRTSRDLTGELDTAQLAALLWTAMSPSAGRWPYPSAGAQYCARLRLVALGVPGLAPGRYEVNEVDRTLVRIGDEPSIEDLEATSMWFGTGATELAGTPAVLALYVRVGSLRQTYGVRALRFAFAEAGHLAQNLTLVAASLGIRTGLVGGFYDDVAHDVLGLDGVNDAIVYLLPLAG